MPDSGLRIPRLPVVFEYQRALDELRRGGSGDAALQKRMSELISLLDLTATLSSALPSGEILDAALLIVMGELQASRCVIYLRGPGGLALAHSRGLRAEEGLEPIPDEAARPALDALRSALGVEELPDGAVRERLNDFIPLGSDRVALVVADVAGKGAPASILMASVHASLQALAGTAAPAALMARLNRFLFANTQAPRYVTLFYAELDVPARRLRRRPHRRAPPAHGRGRGGPGRALPRGGRRVLDWGRWLLGRPHGPRPQVPMNLRA